MEKKEVMWLKRYLLRVKVINQYEGVSGRAMLENMQACLDVVMKRCLAKPLRLNELKNLLKEFT